LLKVGVQVNSLLIIFERRNKVGIKPLLVAPITAAAIAAETKTQKRAIVECKQPGKKGAIPTTASFAGIKNGKFTWEDSGNTYSVAPPYQLGDILYVREPARKVHVLVGEGSREVLSGWQYAGDSSIMLSSGAKIEASALSVCRIYDAKDWLYATNVPKTSVRQFLEVVNVEVERLCDISEEDVLREGVPSTYPMSPIYCPYCAGTGRWDDGQNCPHCDTPVKRFSNYWLEKMAHKANPATDWSRNPWVWKITYKLAPSLELDKYGEWVVPV
jgi:hypothetical protein